MPHGRDQRINHFALGCLSVGGRHVIGRNVGDLLFVALQHDLHDFWHDIHIEEVGSAVGQHGLLDTVISRHDNKTTIHVVGEGVKIIETCIFNGQLMGNGGPIHT